MRAIDGSCEVQPHSHPPAFFTVPKLSPLTHRRSTAPALVPAWRSDRIRLTASEVAVTGTRVSVTPCFAAAGASTSST